MTGTSVRATLRELVRRVHPAYAVATVGITVATLAFVAMSASVSERLYIHMTTGVAWAGINLFLGVVLESVFSHLDSSARADLFGYLSPKLAFLFPMFLLVAIGSGYPLAIRIKPFPHPQAWTALTVFACVVGVWLAFGWQFDAWSDWRWLAPGGVALLGTLSWVGLTIGQFGLTSIGMMQTLFVGTLIVINGLGIILSGNLRICAELVSEDPDVDVIDRVGRRNVSLARVQAFFLFVIVLSVINY